MLRQLSLGFLLKSCLLKNKKEKERKGGKMEGREEERERKGEALCPETTPPMGSCSDPSNNSHMWPLIHPH